MLFCHTTISLSVLYGYLYGKRSRLSVLKNCIWASWLPSFLPVGQKFLIRKIPPVSPFHIQFSHAQILAQPLCCKNTFWAVATGTPLRFATEWMICVKDARRQRDLQKYRDPGPETRRFGGHECHLQERAGALRCFPTCAGSRAERTSCRKKLFANFPKNFKIFIF